MPSSSRQASFLVVLLLIATLAPLSFAFTARAAEPFDTVTPIVDGVLVDVGTVLATQVATACADEDDNVPEGPLADVFALSCATADARLLELIALLRTLQPQVEPTVNGASDTLAETVTPFVFQGSIVINAPAPGNDVPAAAVINLTTDFPDSLAAPNFVIQWSPAGTSDWETLGRAACEGVGLRTCDLTFTHALNEDGGLRVVYANETSCVALQCAVVAGAVGFDSTPPTSAISGASVHGPSGVVTLPFVAQDDREVGDVDLYYSYEGADFVESGLLPVASAFTFRPADGAGNYAFYTVAHDAAGNAEDKSTAEVDFTVAVELNIENTYSSEYLANGDVLTVDACVRLGANPAPDTSMADITFRGQTVAADFVAGCIWRASFSPIAGVTGIESSDVGVSVNSGAATTTDAVTLSPNRLIMLAASVSSDFVATGDDVHFTVAATYADTGDAANLARVTITDGTLSETGFTNSAGLFTPTFSSNSDLSTTFTVTSDIERSMGSDAPVSAAPVTQDVVWTGLAGARTAVAHASLYNNVGELFAITYCVDYSYNNQNAEGAIVNVRHTVSDEYFSGVTDATGCVVVDVVDAVVGVHDYETTFGLDTITSGVVDSISVTFTKVELTLVPADVFVNVGDAPNFAVCGKFVHNDSVADGATVEIRAADETLLETVTLDGTGCGNQTHAFADLFDQDILAVLTATPEEVDLQDGAANTGRFVATRVVVGTVAVDDAFVALDDTVTYTVPVTYEHDGTNVVSAVVTLTNGDPVDCNATDGSAACPVVKSSAFNDTFAIAILTDEGITNVVGAPVTPTTVWTRILAALDYDDGFVGVGDDITVTYLATYEHDGSNVPSFTVAIADTCPTAFSETAVGADGIATVIINHDEVCNVPVTGIIASSVEGVVLQEPAVAATSADAVWTRVVLATIVPDTFTSTNTPIAFTGTAVYEHDDSNVSAATITVTDVDGLAINEATITVSDGEFTGTAIKAGVYAGVINFVTSNVHGEIGVQVPSNIEVVWTDVLLDSLVANSFVNVGDTVSVSGTAIYAGSLGNVSTGLISLLDGDDVVLGTANIVDGVWSLGVAKGAAYEGALTVRLDSAENDVEGAPISTDVVTWTRVALSLTPPSDVFVNVGDTITYTIGATYELIDTPVTGSTIVATSVDGDELGTCELIAGTCDLELTTANVAGGVYAGIATLDVTSATSGVVNETQAFATNAMTWTKLLVEYTNAAGPFNVGAASDFVVTVRYAHDNELVEDALAIVDGFSIGEQTAFTASNGVATVAGYESAIGGRTLTVSAAQLAEGITAFDTVSTVDLRWTALGFTEYTYSATPDRFENGDPVFAVNTPVTVCTTVIDADSGLAVSSASVLMRGVTRTANATGDVCYSIASSGSARTVRVTSHGLSGMIEGEAITASSDRVVTLRFV